MPFTKGNKLGGRPKAPHTIKAEKAREYIIERVVAELDEIMSALIAKGKAGDVAAIKDLLDRAFGKAKETVEVQGLDFLFDGEDSTVV